MKDLEECRQLLEGRWARNLRTIKKLLCFCGTMSKSLELDYKENDWEEIENSKLKWGTLPMSFLKYWVDLHAPEETSLSDQEFPLFPSALESKKEEKYERLNWTTNIDHKKSRSKGARNRTLSWNIMENSLMSVAGRWDDSPTGWDSVEPWYPRSVHSRDWGPNSLSSIGPLHFEQLSELAIDCCFQSYRPKVIEKVSSANRIGRKTR